MIRFFLSRLAFGALVLLMLSIFVFVLFYVSPSDPARIIAGDKATEALMAQIRVNLGLDKPMIQQYFMFLGNLLQGDLGFSYRTNLPVGDLIVNRIPVTMSLVFGAVVLWLAIGIPIGIASAKNPGSVRDRLGQSFAIVGISFPTFVLGMIALYTQTAQTARRRNGNPDRLPGRRQQDQHLRSPAPEQPVRRQELRHPQRDHRHRPGSGEIARQRVAAPPCDGQADCDRRQIRKHQHAKHGGPEFQRPRAHEAQGHAQRADADAQRQRRDPQGNGYLPAVERGDRAEGRQHHREAR